MRILSHRGYWKESAEKNSIVAFTRSLEFRFGLETDVRDFAGRLVVSHDVPSGREIGFDRVISLFHDTEFTLAVNIKSDGLAAYLGKEFSLYNVRNWFAFDMSIPDMRSYLDQRLPVFVRASEVEPEPAWIEEATGVWFDSFRSDGYDISRISKFLDTGKQVCVVSPELHRWSYEPLWAAIQPLSDETGLMLCTDYPEEAARFFI